MTERRLGDREFEGSSRAYTRSYTVLLAGLGVGFLLPLTASLTPRGTSVTLGRHVWLPALSAAIAFGCLAVSAMRFRRAPMALVATRIVSIALAAAFPVGTVAFVYWVGWVRRADASALMSERNPVNASWAGQKAQLIGSYTIILALLSSLSLSLLAINEFHQLRLFDGSLLLPTVAAKLFFGMLGTFLASVSGVRWRRSSSAYMWTMIASTLLLLLFPFGTAASIYWFGWVRARERAGAQTMEVP